MCKTAIPWLVIFLLAFSLQVLAGNDVKGSRDHPLTGRFTGSWIASYKSVDFDEYTFIQGKVDKVGENVKKLEGKVTQIFYLAENRFSPLQMYRNFKLKLEKSGFVPAFECAKIQCGSRFYQAYPKFRQVALRQNHGRYLAGKIVNSGKAVYVSILCGLLGQGANIGHPGCQVSIIEIKGMSFTMVDAKNMAQSIKKTGSVSVYGIYFDSGEARLKPKSLATLSEISKLLKSHKDLRIILVGHTDNQGDFDFNVALSKNRAEAVKEALTKSQGVDADRLRTWGAGMTAPIASNTNEKGRALNRRVELVAE